MTDAPLAAALAALSPRAFSWRAGRQAGHAVRVASDLCRKAHDADGAVALFERLWPATMQVNRAHGDLDQAVERAAEACVALCLAEADGPAHGARLERLWAAIEADRGGVTDPLAERWGALCAERSTAAAWAKQLSPAVRRAWAADPLARCAAALPCLSALAAARKGPQLMAMFAVGGPTAWRLRRFALPFIARREGADAALAFADASTARTAHERQHRAQACEALLRKASREDEAWARFAVDAHQANTHRHTFEALRLAWPDKAPLAVLDALLAHHPGEEGKLFATARAIGEPARATALAEAGPGDPKVLLHAADEVRASDPALAERWAFIALGWMADGHAYKVTRALIREACQLAVAIGEAQGDAERLRARLARLAEGARTAAVKNWVALWLDGDLGDG